ncbi:MAG: DNA helicase RecQ [Clostridia bacterium]|nr:DNA helicase RecQ [Clostridia bacterium]
MEKERLLKQIFGYNEFLTGQEALIDGVLGGNDVVGIMPTGAGKSLCYQISALLLEGTTLVVSPLISLMKDQVGALVENGVSVAFINSSLSYAQTQRVLDNAKAGKYKLIYIAPERLDMSSFLAFAQSADISMVAVDEAHCVSQWGQNFRPSYLKITNFIDKLGRRPIIAAFTATATQVVKKDIIKILRQKTPTVIATGFDRENLFFEVRKPHDKYSELAAYVGKNKNANGIVYCSTRKSVEKVCADLVRDGYHATRYHAGLSEQERKDNQDDFLYDRKRIMVATNAFGMGIDKSNVGFVIHFNMPKDIESYYQEAGRAGRDGTRADCLLLYNGKDVVTNQFLINQNERNSDMDAQQRRRVIENDRQRLKLMTFYCHTNDCLREYILKYFGDTPEGYCGNCGSCLGNFEQVDITTDAQKIISCVHKTRQRYGTTTIAAVLRGSKAQKILSWRLDEVSTYGILKDTTESRIRNIINHLVIKGYLVQTDDEFPIIKLGENARDVLLGGETILIKLAKETERKASKQSSKRKNKRGSGSSSIDDIDGELYEALRELRLEIAQGKEVPAFVVFSNATLVDMCKKQPQSRGDMLEVAGVGQVKLNEYGEQFISAIRAYLNK